MTSLIDFLSSNSKASMKVGPNTALSVNKMFSVKTPEFLTTSEKCKMSIQSIIIQNFHFSYQ